MSSRVNIVLRKKLLLAVLLAVHVPFLIAYLSGLWRQTHYQFFPFAIGAFVWLFATRRDRQPERWSWPTWILLAVDVACLAAQFYSYSPWLAVVGLTCTLTAWCYANRDAGYDRRLTYLALLPVLVLRLPLNYDEQVIHGLQRLTTTVASKMLHRFGLLHFREGNVLQFPGKRFMGENKGVRNRIRQLHRETVPDTNGTVVAEVISSTVFTQFFLEDVSRLLHKRIAVAAAFDYARLKTAGAVADSALGDAFQKLIANSS